MEIAMYQRERFACGVLLEICKGIFAKYRVHHFANSGGVSKGFLISVFPIGFGTGESITPSILFSTIPIRSIQEIVLQQRLVVPELRMCRRDLCYDPLDPPLRSCIDLAAVQWVL